MANINKIIGATTGIVTATVSASGVNQDIDDLLGARITGGTDSSAAIDESGHKLNITVNNESTTTALSAEKLTLLNTLTTGTITLHSNIAKVVGKTAEIKAFYEASEIATDATAGITNQITMVDDEAIELTDDTVSAADVNYINSKTVSSVNSMASSSTIVI
jgi:hypothetical protein